MILMDIKDALKQGTSVEDLRKNFEAQLAKAQKEVDKESKIETEIETKRAALIDAVLDYCQTIGNVSKEGLENLKKMLDEYLPQLEKRDVKVSRLNLRDWRRLFDWFFLW